MWRAWARMHKDGRVSYRGGKLRIDYDSDRSELFARIKAAFADIGEKTGRKIHYFKRPITVHPTGGACIGQDKTSGVIDSMSMPRISSSNGCGGVSNSDN